jgi:hypothetical protein
MDDDLDSATEPPGTALRTGFETGRVRRVGLSPAAEQRVLDKMRSVDEARARAAKDSRTAYVG